MENLANLLFEELKAEVSRCVQLMLILLKLNTYEWIATKVAILSWGLLLFVFVCFTFLFFSLCMGFYVGELLHNKIFGFMTVAGLHLCCFFMVLFLRSKIIMKVMNVVVFFMMDKGKNNDKINNHPSGTASNRM